MKILAVVLALSGLTGAALGAVEPVVVIRCGRLIDGRADQAMTAVSVQIAGDRIAAIGKDLAVPAGARTIDLGSATCLPRLIDLHAHNLINPRHLLPHSLPQFKPPQG